MKMLTMRLAMLLLGVLLWVLSIHAGTFATATLLPPPITGYGTSNILKSRYPSNNNLGYDMDIPASERDLNNSVVFASFLLSNMKRLETNLGWSDIRVKAGTPSYGMFISFAPEREAVKRGKDGYIAMRASLQLLNTLCNRHNVNQDQCAKYLTNFKFTKTALQSSCARIGRPCSQEDLLSDYRTIDGSCNHISNGIKGESFSGYTRLLHPDYLDGIYTPRRAVNKKPLPSPRLVSISLIKDADSLHDQLTLAVMQWGQFVEHDLSRVATAIMVHSEDPIECCSSEGSNLSPRYVHPFCSPVSVPSDDPYYSKQNVDCMNYVRSVPALRADCTFGAMEQVNQATHYLDGSQVYGSSIRKSSILRSYVDGKLEISTFDNKEYLPVSHNIKEDCSLESNASFCFKSGDPRVNFQPQLAAMHTLWYREHNRIAEELSALNKQWGDEVLFQETRRIVIAEMQHITYHEWIPKVLARKYVDKIEIFSDYDENEDPSVSNSFATAAMRALKSLYSAKIQLYEESRLVNDSIRLQNHFHNANLIKQPGVLDALVRGLATQSSAKVDAHYAEDLTHKLYITGNFGFDVLSLDIQRGRDHGLPSYVHYRTLCGLPQVESFNDFKDVISAKHVNALAKVYSSPEDVDLIIGGLLEHPEGHSLLGPTFSCIIADQFMRSRKGDRYFYTNNDQPKPFSMSQLSEIKKVTLARIFCDNADNVKMMQRNVFEKLSGSNSLVSCSGAAIPRLSLIPWSDDREKYFIY